MSTPDHWDDVYRDREDVELGWYEHVPSTLGDVLALTSTGASVIDIGAGTSRLVDELLTSGYEDITLLDSSIVAVDTTCRRLADRGLPTCDVIVADVTGWVPTRHWDLWHDRAVFHFLVDDEAQHAYGTAMARAVAPGGSAIVSTFAPDGPISCAGLPVARYSPDELSGKFERDFSPIGWRRVEPSPTGDRRPYTVCHLRRREGGH